MIAMASLKTSAGTASPSAIEALSHQRDWQSHFEDYQSNLVQLLFLFIHFVYQYSRGPSLSLYSKTESGSANAYEDLTCLQRSAMDLGLSC
ncbi:hypothetical protein EVAR_72850_1 [Eumeta japonica]|uniref:Uncharacterized protein n=1 Tax=Eumeta variegata TaxID=151549 RepID=A0A4C1T6G5_EUMVA|nr:hypothetical protein EVAR_72850_1 [Eumeta japonica]